MPISLESKQYDDSHTQLKDYYFLKKTVFPRILKPELSNSPLWTSYQGISSSMFPLPQLASIDTRFGLSFQIVTVSKSQLFLFFKTAFHESKSKRCKLQWPERHTKGT